MQLHKRVCPESWLREKNPLPCWQNWTHDNIAPGFSAQCSTNWIILPLRPGRCFLIRSWGMIHRRIGGDWGILRSGHWCTKLCTHLYTLHGPGGCHQQPCHLWSHCPQRLPAPSTDHHQKTSTQMSLCITENSRHVDVFLSSAHVRLRERLSAIFITKVLPVKCLTKHVCVH